MINVHSFFYEENEHLYGPERRLVLFLQGCSIRCKGCANSALWEFGQGRDIPAEQVLKLCEDVDGVTLLGGEPLDQTEALLPIVSGLKKSGKTVVLFTGYKYKELSPAARRIWRNSDIVISGRFEQAKRSLYLQFRGSTNQRVYTHSGKYASYRVKDGHTEALIDLDASGALTLRGFCPEELSTLLNQLK